MLCPRDTIITSTIDDISPAPATVIGTPVNQPVRGLSVARLKRASRMAPARTNTPHETSNTQNWPVSSSTPAICRPTLKMSTAGATPNETRSAIESNSAPKSEVAFKRRAASPSIVSSSPHQTMSHAANSRSPICVVTIEPRPSNRLSAVKLFGIEYRSFPMAGHILPEFAERELPAPAGAPVRNPYRTGIDDDLHGASVANDIHNHRLAWLGAHRTFTEFAVGKDSLATVSDNLVASL